MSNAGPNRPTGPGGEPWALAAALPDALIEMDAVERDYRCVLGDDNAQIGDERFFLRGNLVMPVAGGATFLWTLWVELGKSDYKRAKGLWGHERRADEPPLACTLATTLPLAEATGSLGLAAELLLGPRGRRPEVVLTAMAAHHPLFRRWRAGLTLAEAEALLAHAP
jgi:hypothetical protein